MKRKIGSRQVTNWLSNNSRYVLFLFVLAFLTIMNSHVAEKKIRKITYLKKEVKELNWKYLTLQAQWMNEASLSSLEDQLEENSIGKEGSKPLILKARENR